MRLPTAIYIKAINKPPSNKNKVHNPKHTELHSYSLRDIENSTGLIIEELLANATPVPFSFIFAGNITLSQAPMRLSIDEHFLLHQIVFNYCFFDKFMTTTVQCTSF